MHQGGAPALTAAPSPASRLAEGVVVLGAGVAGLAAAAALRRAGVPVVALEAAGRVGGRAHTASLGGAPFDHGASWLHAAERNPLAALARRHGDVLLDSDARGASRLFVDGRRATRAERAAYMTAWDGLDEATAPARAPGRPDTSLARALDPVRHDPWTPTVEGWEAPIIAAADADALSVQDWWRNQLHGANLSVPGGLGAFVARRLGDPVRDCVRLDTPALRVRWDAPGGVEVETPRGTLRAGACIVTVSTGVLAAGRPRFNPALPGLDDAVAGLPMGLLTKVALRASGTDRLGLPPDCSLVRRIGPGEAPMVFQAWPGGRDHVIGFVGGGAAWALARQGAPAAEAFARAELRRMVGAGVDRALAPGATVTDWGTDEAHLGAYAYARPGCADLRDRVAQTGGQTGGRLVFAGEAWRTDGLAGTVGGAYLSGEAAAARVLAGEGAR